MSTMVERLQWRARTQPGERAFVFLDETIDETRDEDAASVSYADLDRAARQIATILVERGQTGRPVLLAYPPGRAYVEGFLGCLYAGAIAVPAYPPDPARLKRSLPRLRAVVADCGATVALSVSALIDAARSLTAPGSDLAAIPELAAPELAGLDWVATDEARPGPAEERPLPVVDADGPALIQYTSGSTGTPKGVVLSHANLCHNAGLVQLAFGTSPQVVGVSWLPPYHDMGLIGGILQPLYTGFPTVLMSPLTFIHRPLIWLETISRWVAAGAVTMSGGPNFAYDLCVRASSPQQRESLDLTQWTVAFCGAEPVRAQTLDRFAEAFAPAGFRQEALYPCYGLAESTLIVAGGRPSEPPHIVDIDGTRRVGCGGALGDLRVAVVDPDTARECAPGTVGEIWVSGPSVAQGYWNRPEETEQTFGARMTDDPDPDRGYLRTGDLGLVDPTAGLVITGRTKDLIIIRGRNVYPPDVEAGLEAAVAGLRPGCTAAFAVDRHDEERVAIAGEVAASSTAPPADIVAAVRDVLAQSFDLAPATVVVLRPGQIPKTSSGKIQRYACRLALTAGQLTADAPTVLARWDEPTGTDQIELAPAKDGERAEDGGLVGRLGAAVAATLGLPAAAVASDEPLTRLGLDSLRAVALQHALQAETGQQVPLGELLSGTTVARLAERVAAQTDSGEPAAQGRSAPPVTTSVPGTRIERAATEGERALWFVQRWEPASTAYQISRAARIRSPLDADALARALHTVVDRHPALRSCLPTRDGEPVVRVGPRTRSVLAQYDVAGLDEDELRRQVQQDADRPFDLARGPLVRASLFSREPADHVLLLSLHHIITDFWSLSVLVDELLTLYTAERIGAPADLPEPPSSDVGKPPIDVDMAARLDFWRRELAGSALSLDLPTTYPRPRLQSLRGATHELRIEPATVARLDTFAREVEVTRFTALLAVFGALLARCAGPDAVSGGDVVVGVPTAGRPDADSARMLGYLVNPMPVRIRVGPHCSLRELVGQVRRTLLAGLDHAVAFPALVAAIRPASDPSRSPLMQTALALQVAPVGRPDLGAFAVADEAARIRLGGLELRPYRLVERGSPLDLSLALADVDGSLSGAITYCADLFDPPAIARLAGHLTTLLRRALADPDAPLWRLELLDEGERAAVLALADGGEASFAADDEGSPGTTLPGLLARQVARRPDAVAVRCGEQVLTYADLDQRAGRLAALLATRFGVRRGSVVGVHTARGADLIVGFWAAVKAGGAYLPLAADLPPNRLRWLVADARPVVVLTDATTDPALPDAEPPHCRIDGDWSTVLDRSSPAGAGFMSVEPTPDDCAYVIYTSGTTGRPKGVLVPHRGVVNTALAGAATLELSAADRVLQLASCAYDASVFEIVVTHARGAALYPVPAEAAVPGPALLRLLADERITTAVVSPSVLAALPDAGLPDLVRLVVAGESCPPELVARWGVGRRLINAYGPTEAAICATMTTCVADGRRPAIGRPLSHVHTYVLDATLDPVPVGVVGELYLGGMGVAWGYLGRTALTAERFLADPFAVAPGARMYRTGDRGRWLPDGRLDFLGRVDDQVKIRGVRVEPAEVAARLRELLGVRTVAVVGRDGPAGEAELVAYLVAEGRRLPVSHLRGLLRAELPAPLVPAAFVYLDAMPLTVAGKLDRSALPPPTPADRGGGVRLPARTELERTVADVWAGVLGQSEVGIRDHFFDELGGSSLLVAKVANELGRRLSREVPVTHLFEHPTVETLAQRLAQDDPGLGPEPEARASARRLALARRGQPGRGGEARTDPMLRQ